MKPPRQLVLPFNRRSGNSPPKVDDSIIARLTRIESRLVQLMKHVGMKSDGRSSLPQDAQPTDSTKE